MTASMTRSEGGQSTALVTMRTLLPNLRASERRIAELFLADPEASAELAIAEVAERSGTSTTSVIRLCKRLGYKGFKDLRNDVLREVTRESFETAAFAGTPRDIDRSDSIEDIIAKVSLAETLSIADTTKVLDVVALGKAADALAAATRIDIFGLDVRVPGRFRIDDDHRPMPTLIEEAGAIDTHFLIQAVSANLPLHTFEDGFGVAIETAVRPLCADKNVFLKL